MKLPANWSIKNETESSSELGSTWANEGPLAQDARATFLRCYFDQSDMRQVSAVRRALTKTMITLSDEFFIPKGDLRLKLALEHVPCPPVPDEAGIKLMSDLAARMLLAPVLPVPASVSLVRASDDILEAIHKSKSLDAITILTECMPIPGEPLEFQQGPEESKELFHERISGAIQILEDIYQRLMT